MNDYDKNNLMFLMQLSEQGMSDWYAQASEDDITYAEDLFAQAHILAIDDRVAQMKRYKEAQQVLDKFMN